MSNEALTYIEIDIPVCSLTYGVAPCTASIPATGDDKCFNSIATCQDRDNIDLQDVTLRFAVATAYLPRSIEALPNLAGVPEFSPAAVSLGENLGQRASLKVTFLDHPHSDTGPGFDKYHSERDYDPYRQGSMWGKFRARQPFLRGRALRWISGFVGQTIAEMETRHFFIESIEGPTSEGKFSITAKDALKFLDGDRAQAPVLSNGFLVAAIDDNDTAATLSPSGIGNAEYPASGYANIGGNEICSFTRSGDALTITRAQLGTVASSHSEQDRVQLCLRFAARDPADIIADLAEDFTDTPAGYVQRSAWLVETGTYLNRLYTATIAEPTPVNKLISEVTEQAALAIWDDNVGQQIRLQVLRPIVTDADRFSESNTMRPAMLSVADQPEKRVSRVQVYFGQIDPTKRVDDPDNYRSTAESIDTEAEEDYGAQAIKKIYARWIPALGRTIAERLGTIVLSRYRDAPRRFGFDVMRRSVTVPELGVGYRLQWRNLQDEFGAADDVPIQIIRLQPGPATIHVDAEEMRFAASEDDLTDRQIIIDSNINNVNLQEVHDSIFPPLELGQTVTCTIAEGVIVGSVDTSLPAFDVGTWAGSPTINVINLGRIQGTGGAGGRGGNAVGGAGVAGSVGGVALFTREAINLTDTSGEIFGGGGGAGGAGAGIPTGGGGGGGAGQLPGAGGANGTGSGSLGQPGAPGTTEAGGQGGDSAGTIGDGGDGGGPGLAGAAGASSTGAGGSGGSPGLAIDGISFVTTIGSPGDRRGGTAN